MTLAVPIAAPARIGADERAAVHAAVDAVLRDGPYIGGPVVERFEAEFAACVGPAAECVSVDNGSNALTIAIAALGLAPGREVLVPPNDGGFAAASVQAAGLRPVVTDVGRRSGLVGPEDVAAAWSPDVAGVVVTHLHGLVADTAGVRAWCEPRGAVVVEDCAQAHGATRGGTPVGSVGHAAAFSFYPTKNLAALGDGGAVVTGDPAVAARARLLRQYGWDRRFRVTDPLGRNSRLDAVQAAVLSARLPFLERNNARRRAVVARYQARLPRLEVLGAGDGCFVAHHAVVRVADRDRLRAALADAGIGSDVHYPHLVPDMPGIELARPKATPNAERLGTEILSLPCFPTLTEAEVDAVCDVLAGWSPPDVD